jgi:hypothetical protein
MTVLNAGWTLFQSAPIRPEGRGAGILLFLNSKIILILIYCFDLYGVYTKKNKFSSFIFKFQFITINYFLGFHNVFVFISFNIIFVPNGCAYYMVMRMYLIYFIGIVWFPFFIIWYVYIRYSLLHTISAKI